MVEVRVEWGLTNYISNYIILLSMNSPAVMDRCRSVAERSYPLPQIRSSD